METLASLKVDAVELKLNYLFKLKIDVIPSHDPMCSDSMHYYVLWNRFQTVEMG